MSYSDDEDDFQSADEEGFGDQHSTNKKLDCETKIKQEDSSEEKTSTSEDDCKAKQRNDQPVIDVIADGPSNDPKEAAISADRDGQSEIAPQQSNEKGQNSQPTSAIDNDGNVDDDDEEEEEEACYERIREKNLKLARKFSAEIAKNNKISAPIPVKSSKMFEFRASDTQFTGTSDSDLKAGFLPPAPPPTPALSSSYNNLEEQQTNSSTSDCAPTMKTQYGWRLPPKSVTTSQPGTPPMTTQKGDEARKALDRLSENLLKSEKNLFERVAEDLQKVSIKSDGLAGPETSASSPSLPSISDLGSTLGGWSWSGASKLLSSASQVTSQVGSVLDSVVGVTQHLQPQSTSRDSTKFQSESKKLDSQQQASTSARHNTDPAKSGETPDSGGAGTANDAFVDFTLNAMESLGKKAFDVMTERDKSGSLQIKGLGRPWEHLLNLNKGAPSSSDQRQSEADKPDASSPIVIDEEAPDEPVPSYHKSIESDHSPTIPSTLKNRKRNTYQDVD